MTKLLYTRANSLSIKTHPDLNEKWVQDRIADDPTILGLGDVILKDRERIQPAAGRLDLLLQDSDGVRRYEVEVQLGQTDESHIVRTIEYWDIERKRYPQYEHCAVIVAEDITSRFLNIISLFNGSIPIIAIQMRAVSIEDKITLFFTKVLDEMTRGLDEEDESEVVDRSYWGQRGTPTTVKMADDLLEMIHTFDSNIGLKFNKFYIGLTRDGQSNLFALFRPRKNNIRLEFRSANNPDIEKKLDEAGLDVMDYDARWHKYRVRLTKEDLKHKRELLTELLKGAWGKES